MFNEEQEEHLGALLRQAPLSRLDEAATEIDRLALFDRAISDFSALLERQPAQPPRPRLRAAHFDRPLYVLTAALLKRASPDTDVDTLTEADLLRTLLASMKPATGTAGTNAASSPWTRRTSGPRSRSRPCSPQTGTPTDLRSPGSSLTTGRNPITADRYRPLARPALPVPPPHALASSSSPRSNLTVSEKSWSATYYASTQTCWPPPSMRHPTGSSLRR